MALGESIRKDFKWRLADPLSLLLWIGIPLLIGGLMSMLFGGDGVKPKAHLLIADRDDSPLSNLLVGAAGGGGFMKVEAVTLDEGRRRIDDGDGSAFLVIPAGFGRAVRDDLPTELTLRTNPSQRILPKFPEIGLEILAEGTFYVQRIAGDLVRKMFPDDKPQDGFFGDLRMMTIGAEFKKLEVVEDVLMPPVLTVTDELTAAQKAAADSDSSGPGSNIGLLMFPGILFMAMLFMAQGISFDLWREKDQGTLARLLCSPTGTGTFVLAKLVSGGALMACVGATGLALGYFAFELPARALPGALLWLAFAGSCMLLLFFLVQMFATTSRGANVLTSALLFPLMMIGGSFFPFEAMPKWMAAVGMHTPNGIAVVQLKAMLEGKFDAGAFGVAAGQLAGIGLLLFLLCSRLVRSRFAAK